MSTLSARALPSCRYLSGPPGSGKTVALAEEIDLALRKAPNPYLVAIISPSPAGATALRDRVLRLSGVTRTQRYSFRTLQDWLYTSAKEPPVVHLAPPATLSALSQIALSQSHVTAEFAPAPELVLDPCDSHYADPNARVMAALSAQGLHAPFEIASAPGGHVPLLDQLFVDDIHLMSSAWPWLEQCFRVAQRVVVTYDPHWPALEEASLLRQFIRTDLSPRQRRRPVPLTSSEKAESIKRYPNVDVELQHLMDALAAPTAPDALVFASALVEARLLLRAALSGRPPRSQRSDSVYCSTELRLVSLVLHAVADDPFAIAQLLDLQGVGRAQLWPGFHRGRVPGIHEALNHPDAVERAPEIIATLTNFREQLGAWRTPAFTHELVESIGSWCCTRLRLERPWIFEVLAAEVARLPLSCAELTEAIEYPVTRRSAPDATEVLAPEDLDGGAVGTLWVSLTHERPSRREPCFLYRTVSRATRGVVLSQADLAASTSDQEKDATP